ncbi:MAG: oxygen-independent coproporphyrinogen III oxidase-like protein [Proteobacteria bacterium]|nr:oxygen-independent coproporphyrinogen III oxidase-like protein [Pseudomonadota bacterium]MDE3208252.1 oxygen-independent coproporphyrinogen III oxidase-like protein [Pseudomonadota bacterium]
MEGSLKPSVEFFSRRKPGFGVLPPLSLYIHLPWCEKKCPYCDFNSHAVMESLPEKRYIAALLADLEQALPQIWGRTVQSVFIGGGTPSLFSAESLDLLLSGIRARVRLNDFAEVTLEANPGSVESDKFREFRSIGINRLSIGIQSFDGAHLECLGRIHNGPQALNAAAVAAAVFENFNLDFMFALPQQTQDQVLYDLTTAIGFSPPHLSFYQLTLEPNTMFYRHPPVLPDDDASFDMEQLIWSKTADSGYDHYETSAYAKPGFGCRHNLNYWMYGDYLGLGAGAHSKLSFTEEIVREVRLKHPQAYMDQMEKAGSALSSKQPVQANDVVFEFMMNALRLTEGFKKALFSERTGLPFSCVTHKLDEAEERGWLNCEVDHVYPTAQGRLFLNDLLQLFLPA